MLLACKHARTHAQHAADRARALAALTALIAGITAPPIAAAPIAAAPVAAATVAFAADPIAAAPIAATPIATAPTPCASSVTRVTTTSRVPCVDSTTLSGVGSHGSMLNWEHEEFDAFVKGGEAEAEAFFSNEGEPVHCLSTRFEGVNYRASMLIGMALEVSKGYLATYNPNYYNEFTTPRDPHRHVSETEEERKRRTNGRWLRSFWKALEHTKRTGGCLIQVGCALTLEPCGPVLLDRRPRARVNPGVLVLAVWQPLQTGHKDGKYSDMQVVEKMMAKGMGIPVLKFEFEEAEVSEMRPTDFNPALTAAALALTAAAAAKPDASAVALIAAAALKVAVAETGAKEEKRDEKAFKKRLDKFLLVDLEEFLVKNKIC